MPRHLLGLGPQSSSLEFRLGLSGRSRPSLFFRRHGRPLLNRGPRGRDDVLHHVALVFAVALAGRDGYHVACSEGVIWVVDHERFGVVEELLFPLPNGVLLVFIPTDISEY